MANSGGVGWDLGGTADKGIACQRSRGKTGLKLLREPCKCSVRGTGEESGSLGGAQIPRGLECHAKEHARYPQGTGAPLNNRVKGTLGLSLQWTNIPGLKRKMKWGETGSKEAAEQSRWALSFAECLTGTSIAVNKYQWEAPSSQALFQALWTR